MKRISLLTIFVTIPFLSNAQIDFSEKNKSEYPLFKQMEEKITNGDYEAITSVLIAKNGNLLFEKYFNGANQNTMHNTRSVTKTMASILTGIAIDKGYIKSEKDKILDYVEAKLPLKNQDPRKQDISIEDLLTMSSILECDDGNMFSRGNEERMYIVEDWLQFFLDLPIRSYPFGPKPEDSPYARIMSYCSAGAAAMAEVIESAVKMPLDNFAKENLFDPLDIKDYKLHYNPSKTLNTAGGSEYKSRDFLKIIQMFLQDGQWSGKQVLSKEWIAKATTPKVNARENVDYGYLLWIKSFGKETKYNAYYMSGNGGQKVLSIPSLDAVVVITTTNYGNRKAHAYTDELMNDYIVPTLLE
ncbi:6-aminohexanoate-oligomer exohydrolase [Flagellimonas maritima]|uniref:6-aminohexanoate-oligomer exohydrolase n=1 Tax=Flagellimonas maritima TaxID=1383885 RepID=A0A2Z4LV49_9FLAO|nr:serine hydrolase [Allomuricauda aurantiaca]AWX45609.1 6-aminohexanoate-oligomer exohydrolase [Allomuricauda aurantiaca]